MIHGCVECIEQSRAWWVDMTTGDLYCRHHGKGRNRTRPVRSTEAVAGAIRRTVGESQ